MDEARQLYQKMKTRDEAAYDEFFALSTAHFHVLGKEIIDEKFAFFRKHFENVLLITGSKQVKSIFTKPQVSPKYYILTTLYNDLRCSQGN